MKTISPFLIFCFFLGACYVLRNPGRQAVPQPVNAVLGDESFKQAFGRLPHSGDPEELRIKTHLAFVENKLRNTGTDALSESARENRARVLDLLADYRQAGRFPANYDYPGERKPCFIDRDGAICAVGYLVEQTSGRALAEKINAMFQYDYIADMHMPELSEWVSESGLSLEECAMIQPQYFRQLPDEYMTQNHIATEYAIASGVLAGLNIPVGIVNSATIRNGVRSPVTGILGIASGAASLTLGLTQRNRGKGDFIGRKTNGSLEEPKSIIMYGTIADVYSKNPANAALSWANISTGAASIALGAWNLFGKSKTRNSSKCPDFSIAPLPGSGAVVSFTGKF